MGKRRNGETGAMPGDLTIREFEPGDVERVVEIALLAWEPIYASYRGMLGDELFDTLHPDWKREKAGHIRRGLADGRGAAFVAKRDGEIVGFVTACAKGNGVGEIGNNAVQPAHQGRGIAGRLYERAFEWMRGQGMRFAEVGTGLDPAHAPARRAYEKAGFDRAMPNVTYFRKL